MPRDVAALFRERLARGARILLASASSVSATRLGLWYKEEFADASLKPGVLRALVRGADGLAVTITGVDAYVSLLRR